jgi:hypothetical protein
LNFDIKKMKNKYKKLISFLLIIATLAIMAPKPAHAEAWGTNMAAALLEDTLNKTYDKIKSAIIASLRITAIRIIQGRMQALLTGSPGQYGVGGGGMVIPDWRNFIYGTAERYAMTVTNTFFMTVQSTATMAVNQTVLMPAMKAIDSLDKVMTPNIQNYVAEGKTSNMFQPGATRNSWETFGIQGQPQNGPAYYYNQGLSQAQVAYQQTVEKQIAQGIAGQGFTGVDKSQSKGPYSTPGAPSRDVTASNGKQVTAPPGSDYQSQSISTPGSIVAMLTAQVQGMGVQMIAMAQSIPDIVASMVTQTLTQMMQQGIAKVTQPIDQALAQVHNSTIGAMQQGIQSGMRR